MRFSEVGGRDFRLWAKCLGEGSCWTLTGPDCLIGWALYIQKYSAHKSQPRRPSLAFFPPLVCCTDIRLVPPARSALDFLGQPGLGLYIFLPLSLSSRRTKANKAGVLLGIFITLHDHPECERWDGLNYVQYTHRRLHILV